jgi:hypothetical protein
MTRVTILIAAAVMVGAAGAQQRSPEPEPAPEAAQSSIQYASVQEALAALRVKPGVEILQRDGWTLAQDLESPKSMVLWSFAPPIHPAYPSVVRRRVYEQDGSVRVEMQVLCEAAKPACDDLAREFQELTDRLSQGFNDAR